MSQSNVAIGYCIKREWNPIENTPKDLIPKTPLYELYIPRLDVIGWGYDLTSAFEHCIKHLEISANRVGLATITYVRNTLNERDNNPSENLVEYITSVFPPDEILVEHLYIDYKVYILFKDLTKK